jgi:cytochrome b561
MSLTANQRYGDVAIFLHWTIAACILFNMVSGHYMETLPKGELKHIWVSLHATSGLSVLVLSVVRIAWRISHKPPQLDQTLSTLVRLAAEWVHRFLYFMMLAMPLTGWAISSSSTRKVLGAYLFLIRPIPKIWFLVDLPLAEKISAHDQAVVLHAIGGWLLAALLVGHVAGALKHQFLDRQPQFARMWFGRKATSVKA